MKTTILASAMALMLACGSRTTGTLPALPAMPVHLVSTQTATGDGWVAATLSATQRAVLSTRMAAAVRKIYVTEGQRVAAGALLISLTDEDLQGSLKAAEAAQASASAQLRRIQALFAQDASTPSELEMTQTQNAQAKAAVSAARANLAFSQIRAPFAGIVQVRHVNEGDFVGPGLPLLELEGQRAVELQGSVSEAEASHLKMGQAVTFEADGRTGTAEITGLATGGDSMSHRGTLRARVAGGGEPFRTGTFARIRVPGLTAQADDTVFVPKSALVQRGELTGVFVAQDGKAYLRWLSVGEAQGDQVPVRAGLVKNEPVIDRPGELKDGQPVKVL